MVIFVLKEVKKTIHLYVFSHTHFYWLLSCMYELRCFCSEKGTIIIIIIIVVLLFLFSADFFRSILFHPVTFLFVSIVLFVLYVCDLVFFASHWLFLYARNLNPFFSRSYTKRMHENFTKRDMGNR